MKFQYIINLKVVYKTYKFLPRFIYLNKNKFFNLIIQLFCGPQNEFVELTEDVSPLNSSNFKQEKSIYERYVRLKMSLS